MTMLIESAFLKVLCPAGRLADELSGAPEVYTERLLEEAGGFADVARVLRGRDVLDEGTRFRQGQAVSLDPLAFTAGEYSPVNKEGDAVRRAAP
jgi:hypothetical protein